MQLWFLVYSSWGPKSKSNNNNQVKNALHTHINLNRETTTTTQGELFKQKRTNSNSLKKIVSHEARSWFTNSVSLSLSFCVSLSVSASTPSPTPTPQAHWTRTCRWRRGRVRRTLAWRSPSLWCTPRAGCWPVRSPAASCSRCSWRTSTRQARTSTSTTCRGVGGWGGGRTPSPPSSTTRITLHCQARTHPRFKKLIHVVLCKSCKYLLPPAQCWTVVVFLSMSLPLSGVDGVI